MIKKYILIVFASFLFSCSTLPLSNSIDSSINTADRHIWIPPDENDLEQRRILQSEFDKIEQGIIKISNYLNESKPFLKIN